MHTIVSSAAKTVRIGGDQRGLGPVVGKHLLMAYLPASEAVEGNSLRVEYMGEQYPVTVARASATPLFDPENSRIRS